jgi:hypothetical protein
MLYRMVVIVYLGALEVGQGEWERKSTCHYVTPCIVLIGCLLAEIGAKWELPATQVTAETFARA